MIRWLADAPALAGFYTGAADFPHRVRSILEEETALVGVVPTTVLRLARLIVAERLPPLAGPEDASLTSMLRAQGFQLLTLDAETAEQASGLASAGDEGGDAVLIATAQRAGAIALTNDPAVARYGVPCLWSEG